MTREQHLSREMLERRGPNEYATRIQITADRIDENGHMNYLQFQDLFGGLQATILKALVDANPKDFESLFGVQLVVKAIKIEYVREVRLGDHLQLIARASVGNTSLTFSEVAMNDQDQVVAECEFVLVTTKDGQAVPLPEPVRKAFVQ
jgi:acyl-CoA thioesterase FadM